MRENVTLVFLGLHFLNQNSFANFIMYKQISQHSICIL